MARHSEKGGGFFFAFVKTPAERRIFRLTLCVEGIIIVWAVGVLNGLE